MNQRIAEPVSVALVFKHATAEVAPVQVSWRGRMYKITKIGFHHTFRDGRTLIHVFSVVAGNFFMRLKQVTGLAALFKDAEFSKGFDESQTP
jgi:hypothetical protein